MKQLLIVVGIALITACDTGQRSLGITAGKALEGDLFPAFMGHTLQGRTIDNSIFTDRITLVSTWRLGCQWSMEEIPEYNRLMGSLQDPRFQMIAMAPQTRDELEAFYASEVDTEIARMREEYDTEIPKYDVIPMCFTKREQHIGRFGAQCEALQELLGVDVFPVTFIVGPDGIIRHRHEGLIVDPETLQPDISLFRQDLDSLLRVL